MTTPIYVEVVSWTKRPYRVEASSFHPPFVVHAALHQKGWTVTHLPTGGAVARGLTKRKAEKLAAVLSTQPAWLSLVESDLGGDDGFTIAEPKRQVLKDQLIKAKEIAWQPRSRSH